MNPNNYSGNMTLNEFVDELLESFFDGAVNLEESSLPPGFSDADFQSLSSFVGKPEGSENNVDDIDPSDNNNDMTNGQTNEDIEDLGANMSDWSDEDLTNYLNRTIGTLQYDKQGNPKLDKKGKQKYKSGKTKVDRYTMPYIHRSSILGDNNKPIDPEKLKEMIKVRPAALLKQNKKMQKSSGVDQVFFDISLPALRGLVLDEKRNKFKIVTTCPNAGECKIYCYARKGGYVQFKAVWLAQTRVLNFLLNDYVGWTNELLSELQGELDKVAASGNKSRTVTLRWHDSGDFISAKYLEICYDVAKKTPTVTHYFYTKNVSLTKSSNPPPNVVFNLSYDTQEKDLIAIGDKKSVTVPKPAFDRLMHKKGDKWVFNDKNSEMALKKLLANRYGHPLDSVITYQEMLNIPYDPSKEHTPYYNVIIVPGDGDVSASRKDVLNTYLLKH